MDLSAHTATMMDVKFFDEMNGVIAGASDSDTEKSHARLIVTHDGGVTWKTAYESTRPYEITWKLSFPTREVGYATIQKYNPDPKVTQHYVAKTTDGGRTWREIAMANDVADREFGVGFVTADTGWVGTGKGGYHTSDGGKTWNFVEMGRAVNKIRIVPTEAKNGKFVSSATPSVLKCASLMRVDSVRLAINIVGAGLPAMKRVSRASPLPQNALITCGHSCVAQRPLRARAPVHVALPVQSLPPPARRPTPRAPPARCVLNWKLNGCPTRARCRVIRARLMHRSLRVGAQCRQSFTTELRRSQQRHAWPQDRLEAH